MPMESRVGKFLETKRATYADGISRAVSRFQNLGQSIGFDSRVAACAARA